MIQCCDRRCCDALDSAAMHSAFVPFEHLEQGVVVLPEDKHVYTSTMVLMAS